MDRSLFTRLIAESNVRVSPRNPGYPVTLDPPTSVSQLLGSLTGSKLSLNDYLSLYLFKTHPGIPDK